jgi:hypothetical protein
MIELASACKTFMPVQTLDLHRVINIVFHLEKANPKTLLIYHAAQSLEVESKAQLFCKSYNSHYEGIKENIFQIFWAVVTTK